MEESAHTSGSAAGRAAAAERIARRLRNPLLFRAYLLARVPLALIAGLRIAEVTPGRCAASVPYGWRTSNPFRSTYFAALSMAAEMSTGALALLASESAPEPVALIIVGLAASFEKKATARATFLCEDGDRASAAVDSTLATGEPATAEMRTVGTLPDGTVVARFTFTWSFKVRRRAGAVGGTGR